MANWAGVPSKFQHRLDDCGWWARPGWLPTTALSDEDCGGVDQKQSSTLFLPMGSHVLFKGFDSNIRKLHKHLKSMTVRLQSHRLLAGSKSPKLTGPTSDMAAKQTLPFTFMAGGRGEAAYMRAQK